MADYTHVNLRRDVPDMAAMNGMEGMDARFPTRDLGLSAAAISLHRLEPGVRQPFGHRHASQEEVYVVVEGSGRVKLDEEVVELATWDAVRVPPRTWRCFEAGPGGIAFVAVGAPQMDDPHAGSEMAPGWWSD
ncbi:cupin domain-containing protein [Miltoncostaea marina]|uniref:cupin domain-containing protein n=1 Tax=Miltoncostaea marina TaxID=2843215 RepID=UPI001C3E77C0|nr:cupin domain-containing protein [Miltoncostaea marina]